MYHLRMFLARRWMILIGISYVAIGMLSRIHGYHQEDAAWFVHVTSRILDGSFDLYSERAQPWAAPPLGMAFTYSPLMPLILAPFVFVGQAFGFSARGIEVLIGLPWLVCDVLLTGQIATLSGKWAGRPDTRWQVIAFLLCLLTFIVPVSSVYMGHHESLIVLMILLALRAPTMLGAGLCWGLALALKQPAAFALLPMAFLVLRDAWRLRWPGVSRLLAFFLPIISVPAALILPFWLKWPTEVHYSLLGVESHRILYGTNLPHLLDRLAARLVPELQPALNTFLVQWSSPFLVLVTFVFSMTLALRHPGAYPAGTVKMTSWNTPQVWKLLIAAMGANMAVLLVLGKWSETHYQLIPLMLLLALDLLERPDYPYIYILFTLAATLFYAFAQPVSAYWRLAVFIALTGYFAARAWRLSASSPARALADR